MLVDGTAFLQAINVTKDEGLIDVDDAVRCEFTRRQLALALIKLEATYGADKRSDVQDNAKIVLLIFPRRPNVFDNFDRPLTTYH